MAYRATLKDVAAAAEMAGHGDDLVVVEAALDDHVDLDRAQPRGARGLDVAGVGDEKCLVHRHDHGAVRGREAGGEPAVVFVGEQDGVQMRLRQHFAQIVAGDVRSWSGH